MRTFTFTSIVEFLFFEEAVEWYEKTYNDHIDNLIEMETRPWTEILDKYIEDHPQDNLKDYHESDLAHDAFVAILEE